MTTKKQTVYNLINIITDVLLSDLAYIVALKFWLFRIRGGVGNTAENLNVLIVYSLFLFIVYKSSNLYNTLSFRTFFHEILKIIQINIFGILSLALIFYFFRIENFSRGVFVSFFIFSVIFIILKRYIFRYILYKHPKIGFNENHVLVVGSGKLAQRFIKNAKIDRRYFIKIVGYISKDNTIMSDFFLGEYSDLETILTEKNIDQVVLALEPNEIGYISDIIDVCEKQGTKIYVIPFYNDFFPAMPEINSVGDIKLLNMRTIPLDNSFAAIQKRTFDIIFSLLLIILSSPIMLICAVGVKISSPGPIVFKQDRIGRNKKLFKMYKFRSMRINDKSTTAWSTDADSRKTRFGSFIRKTSLDELLQFFNVLQGTMSLVGPRPEIPFFVNQFKETIPLYMLKHQVKPGITGWAQVNGYRGDTSIEERIRHDLWYIENWNILLDIKIIIMTFSALINSEKINPNKQ